ncbi:MAG: hypothetical protein QOF48_3938 [Verrucomicrobiota bacterium]|jgi:thioredoxin-like negative regulator of GroEL
MSNNNPKNTPAKNAPAAGPAKPGVTTAGRNPGPATPIAAQPKSNGPDKPSGPIIVAPLFRRIDWLSFAVTALFTFIGYWWTLAPDLTLEDCGELATASKYAGIPHPPGYPVWTLYSWLFTLLPISNIAYRVALSSAVAGALSCGLVALMVSRGGSMIMEGISDLKNIDKRWENALCLVSGFVAGLLIAFNGFMWSQAIIVEVYTLSTLSMTGVMACVMRWIYAPQQRRYLYLAFFWFGICFNNHQSLLVLSVGLEVAILVVQPKFARNFLFWNVMIYLFGIGLQTLKIFGMLEGNVGLQIVYHAVGLSSLIAWLFLLIHTKITVREILRDIALALSVGYVAIFFGTITNFVTALKYPDTLEYRATSFAIFNIVGLGVLGAFLYLIRETRRLGTEWASTLGCGGAWILGAAFYLYMPLAGMSDPPLMWGYPRTVAGFFHAFTRGQYERIHPTIGQSIVPNAPSGAIFDDIGRYIYQIGNYIAGTFDEFNLVYVLIGLVPLFFLARMQKRERAWLIGLTAIYFMLSLFLLNLLNPAADRQSRDLNRVFFTASHFVVAMGTGYGIMLIGAYISTHYEKCRRLLLPALGVFIGIATIGVIGTFTRGPSGISEYFKHQAVQLSERAHQAATLGERSGLYKLESLFFGFGQWCFDLIPSYSEYSLLRFTVVFGLLLAVASFLIVYLSRARPHLGRLLAVCWLLPLYPILYHWSDNEQRGHYFGYWFGHDMFTPPFNDPKTGKPLYPEMDRDTVLYGGTDPGRFNPTYMIFCESFIPPSKRNRQDPNFDRRDVYLITQNALADGTYLNYIRAQYNRSAQIDPPFFSELFRGQKELESADKTNVVARVMRPLDHFFLDKGDKIEEDRRAGSSAFKTEDFIDLPGLTAKLKSQADPLSKFVFQGLSKDTQQLIASGGKESSVRRALARDLTALLRRELDAWKKLETKFNEYGGYTNAIANSPSIVAGLSNDKEGEKTKARVKEDVERYRKALLPIEKEIADLQAVPSLYESNRFAGVQLTPRTQRFIKQDPRSHTRIRLNRILLEEAYPREIAKSKGGVYPDLEILSASNEDSQRCFSEYLADANRRLQLKQLKPGEDVKVIDNKVQVSGQVAVMAINGLLTKVIFDKNPDHEFYVEESFPLDWMYPHLSPYGIIMKINRQPLAELTDDMIYRDHEFWSQFSTRSIGNWITYDTSIARICEFAEEAYLKHSGPKDFKGDKAFLRDNDGQKAFSKLRSSIAGVYTWRMSEAQKKGNGADFQRMVKEADFAFKQAYAFCPYSPEAIFRYVNLLVQMGRVDDAYLLATTSQKLDPFNGQIDNLLTELTRIKAMPRNAAAPAPVVVPEEQINLLAAQFKAQPGNFQVGFQLAGAYIQSQQGPKATEILDQMAAHPGADANTLMLAADGYAQVGLLVKVEQTLQRLIAKEPENPEGRFQLAAFQAMQNKSVLALESLSNSLRLSAARLAKDPASQNLYAAASADTRLASLRTLPEFQKLLETFKPK